MDFQVVVLAGGTSKKLVPLVSKVLASLILRTIQTKETNCSSMQSIVSVFSSSCSLISYCSLIMAGASKGFASGGEQAGYLVRTGALRTQ